MREFILSSDRRSKCCPCIPPSCHWPAQAAFACHTNKQETGRSSSQVPCVFFGRCIRCLFRPCIAAADVGSSLLRLSMEFSFIKALPHSPFQREPRLIYSGICSPQPPQMAMIGLC
ncbi:hypothetical protein ACQKWADRAFT_195630 [Trichoderma austrokoningii]